MQQRHVLDQHSWRFALLAALCWMMAGFGDSLVAQQVVASEEITLDKMSRYELFHMGNGQTVLYHDEPGSVNLEAYNANLELDWSRELNLDKARPKPVGAVAYDGVVNVLYTFKRDRKLLLKLHRYSERGNLSDSLIVTELSGDMLTPNWSLVATETGDIVVLWNQRDSDTFLFIGVDVSTGRVLYEQVVEVDFGLSLGRNVSDIYVDNRGAAYLWMQENNRRSRMEEHRLKLVQVTPAGDVVRALIPLPEQLVYDLTVRVDELNNRIALGGYYATEPDAAAGSLLVTLPYSLEGQAQVSTVPFEQNLLLAVDQKSKAPKGVRDLKALDILFRKDGTAVLVGEQQKQTIRPVGGRSGYLGGALKTDYLYEDIVISTVSPEGMNLWQEALPKKQFSQDDGAAYSGYFLATSATSAHLIYNDEVRSGGTVSEYSITGTGNIERHSLLNTEYQDLWLRHQAGIQIDANTVVIPSERRARLRLVRISF